MVAQKKIGLKELVDNQNVFASSLLLVFIDNFGIKGMYWNPIVIREEFNKLTGTNITEHNFQKLMSAIYCYITKEFYDNPTIFNVFCQIFNNKVVNPSEIITIADVYDMAWGVEEARIMVYSGEEYNPSTVFSEKVASFIELNLLYHSMLVVPKPLKYKDSILINEDIIKQGIAPEFQQYVLQEAFNYAKMVEDYVNKRKEYLVEEYLRLPLNNGSVESVVADIVS